jgi:hypothetical protein
MSTGKINYVLVTNTRDPLPCPEYNYLIILSNIIHKPRINCPFTNQMGRNPPFETLEEEARFNLVIPVVQYRGSRVTHLDFSGTLGPKVYHPSFPSSFPTMIDMMSLVRKDTAAAQATQGKVSTQDSS